MDKGRRERKEGAREKAEMRRGGAEKEEHTEGTRIHLDLI